jgi:DNA-binding transcriptional ArsR family regulator
MLGSCLAVEDLSLQEAVSRILRFSAIYRSGIIYHNFMIHRRATPVSAAQALADPLRFALLVCLLEAPATVAELVAVTGASQPNVSNHLAVLREQGLVQARRKGRHVEYDIGNPAVAQVVEALSALADASSTAPRPPAPLGLGRTCYDHLAGVLGVAILEALIQLDALGQPDRSSGTIRLGKAAGRTFSELGVDVESALRTRRKFAYGCLDWTEHRPHLGGSLGAALCQRFFDAGWIVGGPNSRAVLVTEDGQGILRKVLRVPAERLEGVKPRLRTPIRGVKGE